MNYVDTEQVTLDLDADSDLDEEVSYELTVELLEPSSEVSSKFKGISFGSMLFNEPNYGIEQWIHGINSLPPKLF
jgi:hypothetical protein